MQIPFFFFIKLFYGTLVEIFFNHSDDSIFSKVRFHVIRWVIVVIISLSLIVDIFLIHNTFKNLSIVIEEKNKISDITKEKLRLYERLLECDEFKD